MKKLFGLMLILCCVTYGMENQRRSDHCARCTPYSQRKRLVTIGFSPVASKILIYALKGENLSMEQKVHLKIQLKDEK